MAVFVTWFSQLMKCELQGWVRVGYVRLSEQSEDGVYMGLIGRGMDGVKEAMMRMQKNG
jgi:hypothetical protein